MSGAAFFIVPSAVAFLAFGDLLARVVYEGGNFGAKEVEWVWGVLAGSAVGLLASTLSRLYASALYALRDTKTPLRFAMDVQLFADESSTPIEDPSVEWREAVSPFVEVARIEVPAQSLRIRSR